MTKQSTTDPQYFAVPDPHDPTTMTYWKGDLGAGLNPWPKGASFGPVAYRSQVPKEPNARRAFIAEHQANRSAWWSALRLALQRDPNEAANRFARLTSRCCFCGRFLSDARSKVLGIGPDCRAGLNEHELAERMTPHVAREHARAEGIRA